jgi:hypothetical protein
MPLSVYLDDCSDDDNVITFLRQAGQTVISPRDVGMRGSDDPDHLEYAAQHGYVLLTANPDDFRDLHTDWQAQGRTHSGIFLVYHDNDPTKDMKPHDFVRAIANLLASGLPIANEVHTLNHWR